MTTIAQKTKLTLGRQNHGWCDPNILFITRLPDPLLPFTTSMPQENGFQRLLNTSCSLMFPSLYPYASFFVFLEGFYVFKTQHNCISVKHSPVPPGRALCSLFLLMGRELYMPVSMHWQRLMNIGGIRLHYWSGNELPKVWPVFSLSLYPQSPAQWLANSRNLSRWMNTDPFPCTLYVLFFQEKRLLRWILESTSPEFKSRFCHLWMSLARLLNVSVASAHTWE